jgi:hypothetical protein
LTLYLSAKFRVAAPHYVVRSSGGGHGGAHEHAQNGADENVGELDAFLSPTNAPRQGQPKQAIVPPLAFILILPYLSLGLAIFIAGTRYFDFRNHGFDVLAGVAAGTTSASFAFRLYGNSAARPVYLNEGFDSPIKERDDS